MGLFEDFRRAAAGVGGLTVVDAIVEMVMICDGGWEGGSFADRLFNLGRPS